MSCPYAKAASSPSRRGLLLGAGGLLAAAGIARPAQAETPPAREAFYGEHQAGIATPQQTHSYFATFDLVAKSRDDVVAMLRAWSAAAARMTAGDPATEAGDGGSALGVSAARLTLTFGFGAGLFVDRYALAAQSPEALVDLPRFNGDQLEPALTGGDLSVQACADDPQVAFHAVRELNRLAYGAAQLRWAQAGFSANAPAGETPRNLLGFKDGTNRPRNAGTMAATPDNPKSLDEVVWVGDEGPAWLRGGSYVVTRRIRVSLEHWDRSDVDFQEQVIGRHKLSGAPLGKSGEFDALDLDRQDQDGNAMPPDTSHVRLGAALSNDGAQMLRRGYSYNDGVKFTAERWPPWRQGMMYDAGLFFVSYQRDPRAGFIKVFDAMSKLDALNQFTTHTGSALFACPPGVVAGEFIGQRLF